MSYTLNELENVPAAASDTEECTWAGRPERRQSEMEHLEPHLLLLAIHLDALRLAGRHADGSALLLLRHEEDSLLLLALRSALGHASGHTLLLLRALVAAHLGQVFENDLRIRIHTE